MNSIEALTDDEDFLELVMMEAFPRAPQQFRCRPDHFEVWNDNEFRARFRLSKETVHYLIEIIRDDISCVRNETTSLTASEKVLITLHYLATGSILQILGDFSGTDKSTISRIIAVVLNSFATLRPQYVKHPSAEEIPKLREGFFTLSGFPKCIGAIDCTLVKIISPGGENAEIFRSRKGFFAFNVQAVCGYDLKIWDIVCRWPGSSHDATVFNNSRLKALMENGYFGDSVLVGDGGYGVTPYLLTPLREPRTPAEARYNRAQIRARNPIERCFGVLKKRFPVLALGIRLKVEKVEAIVVTCCILHNIAMEQGEPEPPVDPDIQAAIAETEQLDLYQEQNIRGINQNNVRYNLIHQFFRE